MQSMYISGDSLNSRVSRDHISSQEGPNPRNTSTIPTSFESATAIAFSTPVHGKYTDTENGILLQRLYTVSSANNSKLMVHRILPEEYNGVLFPAGTRVDDEEALGYIPLTHGPVSQYPLNISSATVSNPDLYSGSNPEKSHVVSALSGLGEYNLYALTQHGFGSQRFYYYKDLLLAGDPPSRRAEANFGWFHVLGSPVATKEANTIVLVGYATQSNSLHGGLAAVHFYPTNPPQIFFSAGTGGQPSTIVTQGNIHGSPLLIYRSLEDLLQTEQSVIYLIAVDNTGVARLVTYECYTPGEVGAPQLSYVDVIQITGDPNHPGDEWFPDPTELQYGLNFVTSSPFSGEPVSNLIYVALCRGGIARFRDVGDGQGFNAGHLTRLEQNIPANDSDLMLYTCNAEPNQAAIYSTPVVSDDFIAYIETYEWNNTWRLVIRETDPFDSNPDFRIRWKSRLIPGKCFGTLQIMYDIDDETYGGGVWVRAENGVYGFQPWDRTTVPPGFSNEGDPEGRGGSEDFFSQVSSGGSGSASAFQYTTDLDDVEYEPALFSVSNNGIMLKYSEGVPSVQSNPEWHQIAITEVPRGTKILATGHDEENRIYGAYIQERWIDEGLVPVIRMFIESAADSQIFQQVPFIARDYVDDDPDVIKDFRGEDVRSARFVFHNGHYGLLYVSADPNNVATGYAAFTYPTFDANNIAQDVVTEFIHPTGSLVQAPSINMTGLPTQLKPTVLITRPYPDVGTIDSCVRDVTPPYWLPKSQYFHSMTNVTSGAILLDDGPSMESIVIEFIPSNNTISYFATSDNHVKVEHRHFDFVTASYRAQAASWPVSLPGVNTTSVICRAWGSNGATLYGTKYDDQFGEFRSRPGYIDHIESCYPTGNNVPEKHGSRVSVERWQCTGGTGGGAIVYLSGNQAAVDTDGVGDIKVSYQKLGEQGWTSPGIVVSGISDVNFATDIVEGQVVVLYLQNEGNALPSRVGMAYEPFPRSGE